MAEKINNLKFLVITPTFNRAHTLLDAVNSVINQTHSNWEYIIVDDCSDDDTELKLKPILNKYPNIHYIRNEVNKGTYKSRNLGLQFAINNNISWDISTTFDSDDFCMKERFSRVNEYFQNPKLIGLRPNIIRSAIRDLSFESYKTDHKIGNAEGTCFYSRECFNILGFFDNVRMGGDQEYWCRCVKAVNLSQGLYGHKVMNSSDPMYIAYKTYANKNLTYNTGNGFRGKYVKHFKRMHGSCSTIDCLYQEFNNIGFSI